MARTSKYIEAKKTLSFTSQVWRAGLYLRLSKEDGDREEGDKFESDSISNQRFIIEDYLIENPEIHIEDTYSDDGYSGTNFDRPHFFRLIQDIRSGKINCVIVKDLSRFGRNYVEAGQYLEVFFPVMDVRFISVIDNIDSHLNPDSINNISVPFKNVMNEEYCRDISIKIKSTFNLKRENGEYIGAFSPYGYEKDPENKNKLIIDCEAAKIVKMIFRLFFEGNVIRRIAIMLNELGIPNPSAYKRLNGKKFMCANHKIGDGLWCSTTIRNILTNRMYIGDMVQGRREKVSHKIAKIKPVKEENWIVKENTHEPIIDKIAFYNIQEVLRRDMRVSHTKKELGLFAGFLKCADCGRAMVKKLPSSNALKEKYHFYVCRTYDSMNKSACTRHSIRSDNLENAVFAVISKYIEIAVHMDDLVAKINQIPMKKTATSNIECALFAKAKEKNRIEAVLLDLYPDWKNDLITKDQYLTLKSRYESELEKINNCLNELSKTYEREKEGIDGTNNFLQNFIKFKNIDKLSREVLISLVNHITIHENAGIEISFKFLDAFERAAEYIETNKKLLANTPIPGFPDASIMQAGIKVKEAL